jgi:hypothetical protein
VQTEFHPLVATPHDSHPLLHAVPICELVRALAAARVRARSSGLPQGVIFPTYGLAEHTVFVCSG